MGPLPFAFSAISLLAFASNERSSAYVSGIALDATPYRPSASLYMRCHPRRALASASLAL